MRLKTNYDPAASLAEGLRTVSTERLPMLKTALSSSTVHLIAPWFPQWINQFVSAEIQRRETGEPVEAANLNLDQRPDNEVAGAAVLCPHWMRSAAFSNDPAICQFTLNLTCEVTAACAQRLLLYGMALRGELTEPSSVDDEAESAEKG